VVREAPTSVGGLAAVLDLNLATASSLVADLERVGFVERSVDPSDRRRTIVVVPTARRECVDRWLEGVTAPLARALGQLSPTERTTFLKAMRCLAAELNDVQEA
jgi:DNA-binding MarR family transcriptional regulator